MRKPSSAREREIERSLAKAAFHSWVRSHVPNGTHWRDANPPEQVCAHYAVAYPGRRGEAHPCAKLGEIEVRIIRERAEPVKALARRFGVAPKTVRDARDRETWNHVG